MGFQLNSSHPFPVQRTISISTTAELSAFLVYIFDNKCYTITSPALLHESHIFRTFSVINQYWALGLRLLTIHKTEERNVPMAGKVNAPEDRLLCYMASPSSSSKQSSVLLPHPVISAAISYYYLDRQQLRTNWGCAPESKLEKASAPALALSLGCSFGKKSEESSLLGNNMWIGKGSDPDVAQKDCLRFDSVCWWCYFYDEPNITLAMSPIHC